MVWATAQYLAYAPTGTVLDWEVVLPAVGRNTTQGRAIGRLGTEEVLTVNAALGRHDLDLSGTWVEFPDVAGPEDCPVQRIPPMFADSVLVRVEQRVARGRLMVELDGRPGDARSAFWARVPGHLEPSAATLAVIGDFVSGGVSQPLGVRTMGRSLDNTLRMAQLVPDGMGVVRHPDARPGARLRTGPRPPVGTGRYPARTASQSISVRRWPGDNAVVSGAALSESTPDPQGP